MSNLNDNLEKDDPVAEHFAAWFAIALSQAALLFLDLAFLKAPLIFLILIIIGHWIAAECFLFFYDKLPFIKGKQYLLIEFLPMALILAGFILTVIIMYHGHISDINNLWFLQSDYVASEHVLKRNFMILMIVFSLQFFAATLLSLHKCNHCGNWGIGIFKNQKTVVTDVQYKQTGTSERYESFTATDTDGNTYSGSVNCGSSPTYDTYETRKTTMFCKLCNTQQDKMQIYRIGLIRKIIDSITHAKHE